ncbi:MAG: hypothetical protein AAB368_02720, partial [bacterium]
ASGIAVIAVRKAQPAALGVPIIKTTAAGTVFAWGPASSELAAGSCFTITLTGWLAEVCSPVTLENRAGARGRTACETVEGYGREVLVIVPESVRVEARAAVSPEHPGVGDQISRQLIVTNTGQASIRDLIVVDFLPASLLDALTPPPAGFGVPVLTPFPGAMRYEWSAPALNLPPGGSVTFVVTGRGGAACAPVAMGGHPAVTALTTCASVTVVAQGPDAVVAPYVAGGFVSNALSVEEIPRGHRLTYRLVAGNSGTATFTGPTLTDRVGAALVHVTTEQPAGFGAPEVSVLPGGDVERTWTAPELVLRPGEGFTVTVTGELPAACEADIVLNNGARLEVSDACVRHAYNSVTATYTESAPPRGLDLVLRRTPATPVPEGPVAYTLIVTNRGSAPVTGVSVVDTLPVRVARVAHSGFDNGTSQVAAGGVVTWTNADALAPGASATLLVAGTYLCGTGVALNAARAFGRDECGPLAS